jgi:hypothetical protein
MYYDEAFEANENLNDVVKTQKKELNKMKVFDTDYVSIYRSKTTSNGKQKNVKIDLYVSGDIGSQIRNAETGQYYKYKVGTKEEDRLFKMKFSTGEIQTKSGNSVLFYDSPEQCENHLMEELSEDIKENWKNKQILVKS